MDLWQLDHMVFIWAMHQGNMRKVVGFITGFSDVLVYKNLLLISVEWIHHWRCIGQEIDAGNRKK